VDEKASAIIFGNGKRKEKEMFIEKVVNKIVAERKHSTPVKMYFSYKAYVFRT